MKKFSKRLTMIVAILLCLVLITSSAVSTTLAKYVITKDATTSVGLEKFGLEVKLAHDGLTASKTSSTGDSATITLNNMTLTQGTTKRTLVATVTGTPTVDANITIDVVIDYATADFTIPAGTFTGVNSDKIYVPLRFNRSTGSTSIVSAFSSNTDTTTEEKVEKDIAGRSDLLSYDSTNDCVTGTLSKGTEVSLSNIGFNFYWAKTEGTTTNNYNEIETYILNHNNPTVNISYTITVSQ